MGGADSVFSSITRILGSMTPERASYYTSLQNPEKAELIYPTLVNEEQVDPDLVAKAFARHRDEIYLTADDITSDEYFVFAEGNSGVIIYDRTAFLVNPYDNLIQRDLTLSLERTEIYFDQTGVISQTIFKDPRFNQQQIGGEVRDLSRGAQGGEGEKAAAERIINDILTEAYRLGATDIHIAGTPKHGDVRIRVDGQMRPMRTFDLAVYEQVANVLDQMTKLQVQDPDLPHGGDFEQRIDGKPIPFRLESIPQQAGRKKYRKFGVRLLGVGASFHDLKDMNIAEEAVEKFYSVARRPKGLFIVTGPTGAGKSRTLGTLLQTMHTTSPNKTFYSLEAPIEQEYRGIYQIPVQGKLTFETALESMLRLDPEVIMVGEIKSKKTAEAAIQLALTGHLVLGTLHTNDAHGTLPRLRHFGVADALLTEVFTGASAQRLVPKLCDHCKKTLPFEQVKNQVKKWIPPIVNIPQSWISPEQPVAVRSPNGCERCKSTGIKGRLPILEVFLSDRSTRESIAQSMSGTNMRLKHVNERSFSPMWQDAMRHVLACQASIVDVFGVLDETDLEELVDSAPAA